ncbi:MAG: hypothetical protein AB1489_19275 [Acidobacteriota bacterium]
MYKSIIAIIFLLLSVITVSAARPRWNAEGRFRRAYVVDGALAALRRSPTPDATCLRRLRVGRALYLLSTRRSGDATYYFVALTRRTRGYIDAAAVASPTISGDDTRLLRIIGEAEGIDKIVLCQVLTNHFPRSRWCAEALLAEGKAAEEAARELTRRATQRPPHTLDVELPVIRYWRNYTGLDRYSRLGVRFRVDAETERFYYDGAAYRRILLRYPRTPAAEVARERLSQLEK